MKKKLSLTTLFITLIGISTLIGQVKMAKVASPDQSIVFSISMINHQPKYTVSRNGKKIIDASIFGLVVNGKPPGEAGSITMVSHQQANENYPTRSMHSLAINSYNQTTFKINGTKPYQIEVKAFNDGIAFRYILTNQEPAIVNAELTTFTIPAGSIIWSQDNITTYEGTYQEQRIEEVKKDQLAGPPLTIKLPGNTGYAAITESGLTDFAGLSLIAAGNRVYTANLTGITHKNGAIVTPWRVILIGGTLNQLVNSDVISNVSARPDKKLFPQGFATTWIKPGKSVWSWLAGNGGVTFDNMKRFSDWAAELGIDYNLVDEGWSKWQDKEKDKWAIMKELVDYSHQKSVNIWVWKAYPDRNGEPGIKDAAARIAFFKQCAAIGITGLKIDFFDTESQEVIEFYQAALRDAAQFHLMLDFHGADKPAGQSCAWPNEMSREGIMGLENNTNWPKHNTTLPFTRFLAGHADYTPLSFTDNVKGTTLTHQVATIAAFTSPFMCLGVDPETLLKSEVKTMVKQIPVIWDETIILPQSKIGEIAIMARRSEKEWYLIALNGETSKSFQVNLSFLGRGNYNGDTLQDMDNFPDQTIKRTGIYSRNSLLDLKLSSGGGFIGRFTY